MTKFLGMTLLMFSLGLTACNTQERYARNNAASRAWLAANPASGHTRVAGNWQPDDEGWGTASFQQSGSRVTGTIGLYTVEGHVSGDDLYLVMSDGGWAYYSAVLKKGAMHWMASTQPMFRSIPEIRKYWASSA